MRKLLSLSLFALLCLPVYADGAPQWAQLNPDQQRWLLEAFNLPDSQLPNEMKQGLLDSIWNLLTPEKRNQVLLYAHLDKPFSQASNATSQVQAPAWQTLNAAQKARAYEMLKMDGTQRMLFDAMLPDLRQATFNTLWAYLSPEVRRAIVR